jgi:hypothetical protein
MGPHMGTHEPIWVEWTPYHPYGRAMWAHIVGARIVGAQFGKDEQGLFVLLNMGARNVGRPYGPHMGIWAQLEPMSPYPMRRPLFRPTRDGPTIRHIRVVWGEWRDFYSALCRPGRERCSSKKI